MRPEARVNPSRDRDRALSGDDADRPSRHIITGGEADECGANGTTLYVELEDTATSGAQLHASPLRGHPVVEDEH